MPKKKQQSQFREAFPESWRPKKVGESIEGTVYAVRDIAIQDDVIPAIDIVTLEGEEKSILCGSASLKKIFFAHRVTEGGFLGIEYRGESDSVEKSGNKLKRYASYYYPEYTYDVVEQDGKLHVHQRSEQEILEAEQRKQAADSSYKKLIDNAEKQLAQEDDSPDF